MRTLVLGGYGNFGARIVRALAGDSGIELLVAGRDAGRANAMAASVSPPAQGVAIDLHAAGFAARLRELGVDLLIHTAGPFQQQDYRVALAAAEAGAHYIDLADGRRFVCDFASHVDAAFQRTQRSAITGASTVPALSSAVIDDLSAGWSQVGDIDICIAPAQTAPRGQATMEAVLGYCGEDIAVWCDGRWQPRRGWAEPSLVHFARLKPRRGALCDIPDLELFPERYAGVRRVMFRAALEVPMGQAVFAALSALRAARLLPRPARFAGPLNSVAGWLDPLGSSLGGMVVRVRGESAGKPVARAWHIAADDDHGPEIPCMATILLARRLARGEALPIGARTATSLLSLQEFHPEFARWNMQTDVVDEAA